MTKRIVGEVGPDRFVKAVRNTRNYFTHYDAARKRHAATEPRDLYRLSNCEPSSKPRSLPSSPLKCADIEAVLERAQRFRQIDVQR